MNKLLVLLLGVFAAISTAKADAVCVAKDCKPLHDKWTVELNVMKPDLPPELVKVMEKTGCFNETDFSMHKIMRLVMILNDYYKENGEVGMRLLANDFMQALPDSIERFKKLLEDNEELAAECQNSVMQVGQVIQEKLFCNAE